MKPTMVDCTACTRPLCKNRGAVGECMGCATHCVAVLLVEHLCIERAQVTLCMAPSVQVSGLDDNGLLSEFKALQMLALYNGPGGADTNNPSEDDNKASLMHTDANNPSLSPNDTANLMEQAVIDALADEGKRCKHMDENLEEFLLQQVTNQAGHACMCMYLQHARLDGWERPFACPTFWTVVTSMGAQSSRRA